jgi:hypothetical protein
MGNLSQMKIFHPKPFAQVSNGRVWQDTQGSRKFASCCMWVPLEVISENFIETGGMWSSGPLFIGNLLALAELPPPKKDLSFLYRSPVVDIPKRSGIINELN